VLGRVKGGFVRGDGGITKGVGALDIAAAGLTAPAVAVVRAAEHAVGLEAVEAHANGLFGTVAVDLADGQQAVAVWHAEITNGLRGCGAIERGLAGVPDLWRAAADQQQSPSAEHDEPKGRVRWRAGEDEGGLGSARMV
jgi:hypothetical protein